MWCELFVDECKFGEGCTYPCHCKEDNAICDALNGECNCDDGNYDETNLMFKGDWGENGCQVGKYESCHMHQQPLYMYISLLIIQIYP